MKADGLTWTYPHLPQLSRRHWGLSLVLTFTPWQSLSPFLPPQNGTAAAHGAELGWYKHHHPVTFLSRDTVATSPDFTWYAAILIPFLITLSKKSKMYSDVKSRRGKQTSAELSRTSKGISWRFWKERLWFYIHLDTTCFFFPDPNWSLELLSTQTMPVVLKLISQPIMCIPVYKQWLQHAENLWGVWEHPLNSSARLHVSNPGVIFHVHTVCSRSRNQTPNTTAPQMASDSCGG